MTDCGCTPKRDYVAGLGWQERHKHAVRGDNACPTCEEFGWCDYYVKQRTVFQAWLSYYLGA